jgi:hypothetical protein
MPAFPGKACRFGVLLGLLALLAAGASPAGAMTFKLQELPDGRAALTARGPILSGDAQRMFEYVKTLDKIRHIAVVVVDSPGGVVDEAEQMALLIHNVGLPVAVGGDATCGSACVLLFAAAPRRAAAAGAMIGVHRASLGGSETKSTLDATDGMVANCEFYGVPAAIIAKIRNTPPGGVTWLTHEDLALMHVEIYEPPAARLSAADLR